MPTDTSPTCHEVTDEELVARCQHELPSITSSYETLIHRYANHIYRSVYHGSGSCEKDGPVEIIAMEKEEQASLMHDLRLGKGERHAHKTSQTLAQRVIPALHMGRFSRLFADGRLLFLRDNRFVHRPEIREAVTSTISLWNGLPQLLTRLAGSDHPWHRRPLAASGGTEQSRIQESLAFLSTNDHSSSSSSVVDVGSSESGASRVVHKGGS